MAQYKKIFVTVGTTRFDLLCHFILSRSVLEALKKIGAEHITVQIGNSDVDLEPGDHVKAGVNITIYKFKPSILKDIECADLVISHAGAGSCLEVLEQGKPLLAVVNEDLMSNHQIELAERLETDSFLYYCTCDTLATTLNDVDFRLLHPFPEADPSMFVKYLDKVFVIEPTK